MAQQVALEVDASGVRLPRTSQVSGELSRVGFEIGCGVECAALERETGALAGIGLALSRVRVLLAQQRLLGDHVAGLEDAVPVAENEVHGA